MCGCRGGGEVGRAPMLGQLGFHRKLRPEQQRMATEASVDGSRGFHRKPAPWDGAVSDGN